MTAPLFSFETDAHGALQLPASDPGATARDRCLAARAVRAGSGAPSGLPPATRVTVQLALRAPWRPGRPAGQRIIDGVRAMLEFAA